MFGRATIRLGIGPHSSVICCYWLCHFVTVFTTICFVFFSRIIQKVMGGF